VSFEGKLNDVTNILHHVCTNVHARNTYSGVIKSYIYVYIYTYIYARKERQAVFVYSCLECPQGALSVRQPDDECAGGRLQRLDQLAVSAVPPLRAV